MNSKVKARSDKGKNPVDEITTERARSADILTQHEAELNKLRRAIDALSEENYKLTDKQANLHSQVKKEQEAKELAIKMNTSLNLRIAKLEGYIERINQQDTAKHVLANETGTVQKSVTNTHNPFHAPLNNEFGYEIGSTSNITL